MELEVMDEPLGGFLGGKLGRLGGLVEKGGMGAGNEFVRGGTGRDNGSLPAAGSHQDPCVITIPLGLYQPLKQTQAFEG